MPKRELYNCHTHIFTIDHVPNEFGKTFVPDFLAGILTIKLVKWYYTNLTSRGSAKYRRFRHAIKKVKYAILDFFRWTIVLNIVYHLIKFVLRWLFNIFINFFKVEYLFSKELRAVTNRFMTMGRYAMRYKTQGKIYDLIEKTYETGTKIVVLPMDMDYMDAGDPEIPYLEQLEEIKKVKRNNPHMIPFIFADPRRIKATKAQKGRKSYSNLLKSSLHKGGFSGIKIYPALGYYPFDKELIDTWLFAQKHEIPIMTHCIEGTVFYRGKKKKEWNAHPILEYKNAEHELVPIPLPQTKNYDWTTNFTHPLNYECLLNPTLLSKYLGYECDLSKLKICLAHFGGSDEWHKYEADGWNNYNKNITHDTLSGYHRVKNTLNHASKRTIWWDASWLSVIYDLMIKYDNVYSDVSFILFNETLFPLLKFILNDDKVNDKILFGTDYYVVTQKKTEKSLFTDLRGYIGEELFYKIAHDNPKAFLKTSFEEPYALYYK
ncbi:amidohydrolase family protein [Croceitalea sp. MTPC5]|uniref:hypothetical protein n=1 Tax=Croceitalea sp. MTPC5 TaxID=3056565 RepID=UPI002B39939B|nr:amidohydrolase family protein [Croceitalea sp. MTPC5]